MLKVLIINTVQFGYHTDTYMYCRYSNKNKYKITYIGFDLGLPPIKLDSVNIINVKVHPNKIVRYIIFLRTVNKIIRKESIDYVFQVYHKFSIINRLFFLNKKFILDIRTGNLNSNRFIRYYKNKTIFICAAFYKRISIISEGLSKIIGIPEKKKNILPLGAEFLENNKKNFLSLNLLYIGTLTSRNIEETILGLSLFIEKYPDIKLSYDIVGSGDKNNLKIINETIQHTGLENVVKLHGRIPHSKISMFLNKCNLGIVYVPTTPWYDNQPVTKLFEYGLAGLPFIATNTSENQKVWTKKVGVLCDSNPLSFSKALETSYRERKNWNSEEIKNHFKDFEWKSIVNEKFQPLFETF